MKDITLSARLAMADKNPDNQEARMPVRRRLNFGDSNDDNQPSEAELERQYQEERARYLEEKKAQYNFDFVKGVPLEGRYAWERVNPPREDHRNGPVAPGNADAPADRPQGDAADQAH